MDYREIDSIMVAKSLATDPAFDDLRITLEPMPNLNGCPLGLYYPDTATVALPLDATVAALLHELGHRHGHYYYNDLSEVYAENYRKAYQPKGKELLYVGKDLSNLPKFGVLFEEGERGAIEVALAYPLSSSELQSFKSEVLSHRIHSEKAPKFYYGGDNTPWIRVEFTKGVDWFTIIGATMAASAVATLGAIGYAIFKMTKELPWIFPLTLVGTGMFFLMRAAWRQEAVKARVAKI